MIWIEGGRQPKEIVSAPNGALRLKTGQTLSDLAKCLFPQLRDLALEIKLGGRLLRIA